MDYVYTMYFFTTESSEALRRMGKVGLLRHLQNLQRKRPRQSVALQKSRRTGFHALEGRALSRPQRVLQVPLLINFNKPTLIVNRRSETFFFESLCLSLPRRSVSAKAGALCGKIHKIIRRTKINHLKDRRNKVYKAPSRLYLCSIRRCLNTEVNKVLQGLWLTREMEMDKTGQDPAV